MRGIGTIARVRRIASLCVVASIIVGACGGGGSKPISQQTCHELAATFSSIQNGLRPGAPFSEQQKATKDAAELNARVDALGGCPEEPSLG